MCADQNLRHQRFWLSFAIYGAAISLGILSGLSGIPWLQQLGLVISEIFIKIFKCLSLPIIGLSILVTITNYHSDGKMKKVGQKVLLYTFSTTFIAATLACLLYLLINPESPALPAKMNGPMPLSEIHYLKHLSQLVPSHVFEPFIEHQVLGALLITAILGFAIRAIPDEPSRKIVSGFFQGLHSALMILSQKVIWAIPLALYGFITVTAIEFSKGLALAGIGEYLAIVVLANLLQGLVVLPLWLTWHGLSPWASLKHLAPALSVAFFSKSSTGTLPITIHCAEKGLGIDPKIAKFVLPLCTTINMNGCAAFIFITVIYLSQCHGIEITPLMLVSWLFISTIAAIGNAGVPMGCFFLSASLLSNMEIPLTLLGVILPFYSLIDMIETTLNVWSDSCVTQVVAEDRAIKEDHLGSG